MNATSSTSSPLAPQTLSKICSTCAATKPASAYHKRSDRPDGLQTSCKDCHRARQRTWARKPDELIGEIKLTAGEKRDLYSEAILRMYKSGIMSRKTSEEALKRVAGG